MLALLRYKFTINLSEILTEGVAVTCSFMLCSWTWWTNPSNRAMWSFVSSISRWYWMIFSFCFSTVLCSSPWSFNKSSFFLSSFSILPIFWLWREIVARKLVFSCCIDVWLSSLAVPSAWRSLRQKRLKYTIESYLLADLTYISDVMYTVFHTSVSVLNAMRVRYPHQQVLCSFYPVKWAISLRFQPNLRPRWREHRSAGQFLNGCSEITLAVANQGARNHRRRRVMKTKK